MLKTLHSCIILRNFVYYKLNQYFPKWQKTELTDACIEPILNHLLKIIKRLGLNEI